MNEALAATVTRPQIRPPPKDERDYKLFVGARKERE
jgi:hypothetical protein